MTDWKPVLEFDLQELDVLGFQSGDRRLIVASRIGRERFALLELDPETGRYSTPLVEDAEYDVYHRGTSYLARASDGRPLFYQYMADKPRTVFFDKGWRERQAAIDATLKDTGRATLLVGPRRSGKTSTLFRLVDAHLRSDGHPRDVAYLPLDHPLLRLAPLGQLVDRALKLMDAKERPRLLLDGIQALPQWPERFVEVVKTRPYPRITGAASVAPAVEEACFDTVHLPTLSFREFCDLRGIPDLGAPLLDPLRPRMPEETDSADDRLFGRVLEPLLADYLVRGGFPETVLDEVTNG